MYGNNLKLAEALIYKLKREFGVPLSLRQPVVNVNDVTTGEITRRYNIYKFRRAIVLPGNIARSFVYDLTYVAANKNFAYGGYFDKDTSLVIIDAKDIKGMQIGTDWKVVIGQNVSEIVHLDNGTTGPISMAIKQIVGSVDDYSEAE